MLFQNVSCHQIQAMNWEQPYDMTVVNRTPHRIKTNRGGLAKKKTCLICHNGESIHATVKEDLSASKVSAAICLCNTSTGHDKYEAFSPS